MASIKKLSSGTVPCKESGDSVLPSVSNIDMSARDQTGRLEAGLPIKKG